MNRQHIHSLSCYKDQWRVLLNVVFMHAERYLTLVGILSSFIGIYALIYEDYRDYKHVLLIVFASFLIISVYISFILTRGNPKQFVEILSGGGVSNSQFVKYASFEATHIINYLRNKEGQQLRQAITEIQPSIRIMEEINLVLSKRLTISRRELCDDFIKFSPRILINRFIKLADLENLKELSPEQEKQAECILKYADEIKSHLEHLISTQADLDQFCYLFQTRSVSGATQLLVQYLEYQMKVERIKGFTQLRPLIKMQKAFKTGVAAHRAISLSICEYLQSDKKDADFDKSIYRAQAVSDKFLYEMEESKSKAITEKNKDVEFMKIKQASVNWHNDVNTLISEQRKQLANNFKSEFTKIYEQHQISKKGVIYIVISSYSRAVRDLIGKVLTDRTHENIQIVICSEEINDGDFSARLMYHQLIEEIPCQHETGKAADRVFYTKAWRSTFACLSSRLNKDKDGVIYLAGCDHFDYVRDNSGQKVAIAYKYSPIDMLEQLKCSRPIKIFIIATAYKLNATTLVNMIKSEDGNDDESSSRKEKFSKLLPKPRRSHLFKWESKPEDYDLTIITNDIVNEKNVIVAEA